MDNNKETARDAIREKCFISPEGIPPLERPKKEKTEAVWFLESYRVNLRMLNMMRYEKEFLSGGDSDDSDYLILPGGDEVLLKNRMYSVRRLVMSLTDSDEKTLLFYHYIKGYPVEKCAEIMDLSRTTAFRLKNKAIAVVEKKIKK